ncbi:MAG: chemotaxis protein CheD [Planctomycetota bacterium]
MPEKVVTVGMAEMKVSRQAEEKLVTKSLGSCLAVAIHDSAQGVAGLLHFVFPMRGRDDVALPEHPTMYAASGLPRLVRAMQALGAQGGSLSAGLAGGGAPLTPHPLFVVGDHNVRVALAILEHLQIPVRGSDIGGCDARSFCLEVGSGRMIVLRPGAQERVL